MCLITSTFTCVQIWLILMWGILMSITLQKWWGFFDAQCSSMSLKQGRIQDFPLGGGGGGAKDYYALTHITSMKPEVPYGPGSSLGFMCSLSHAIWALFLSILIQNGTKNIVNQILGGGGCGACCAPPPPPLWISHCWSEEIAYHDSLEDLICDGGEDPIIVVFSQIDIELGQLFDHRPEQDTQCDVDILQICANQDEELGEV